MNKCMTQRLVKCGLLFSLSGQAMAGAFFGPEPTPAPVVALENSAVEVVSPSVIHTAGTAQVGYGPAISANGQYVLYSVFPGDVNLGDFDLGVALGQDQYLYNRSTGARTVISVPGNPSQGSPSFGLIHVSNDGSTIYANSYDRDDLSNTRRTEAYDVSTQTRKVLSTLSTGEGISPHFSISVRSDAPSQRFHHTLLRLAYVSATDSVDANNVQLDADGNLNLYVKDLSNDQVVIEREIPVSSASASSFASVRFSPSLTFLGVHTNGSDDILLMNIETGDTRTINLAALHPAGQNIKLMQVSDDGGLVGVSVLHPEGSGTQLISEYSILVDTATTSITRTITGADLGVPDHSVTLVPRSGNFPDVMRFLTLNTAEALAVTQPGSNPLATRWPRSTIVVEKEGQRETQQLLFDFIEWGVMALQNQVSADGSVYVFPSSSNQLVTGDTNQIFSVLGQSPILNIGDELEQVDQTSFRVIGSNVYLNGTQVAVGTVLTQASVGDISNLTIRQNGKDVFIRQFGTTAGTNLVVTPEQHEINSATTGSTNVDLVLNANDLFAIEVECKTSNDNITLSARSAGSVFPAAPQSLLVDTSNLNTNTFAQATSLSAYVDGDGNFVPAPQPITASGVYASLTYAVKPVSGYTDITCTALASDANGLPQNITVTNDRIRLDNGINPVEGPGQTVSGTVLIPLGIDPASVVVRLTIGDVSVTTTVDANGFFSFDNIRMADVVVSVEAPRAVAECSAETVGSEAVSTGDITLYRGDINRDGTIDIADFTFLSSRFGLSEGDNRFRSRADLNKDGTINVQDLAILSSAVGLAACDPAAN